MKQLIRKIDGYIPECVGNVVDLGNHYIAWTCSNYAEFDKESYELRDITDEERRKSFFNFNKIMGNKVSIPDAKFIDVEILLEMIADNIGAIKQYGDIDLDLYDEICRKFKWDMDKYLQEMANRPGRFK